MPVYFWDDPDGKRYRSAYFDHEWEGAAEEVVWRHGDWVTVTGLEQAECEAAGVTPRIRVDNVTR